MKIPKKLYIIVYEKAQPGEVDVFLTRSKADEHMQYVKHLGPAKVVLYEPRVKQ